MKCTAIILSAGKGSRMNSDIHKQYLLIGGKPVVAYSLQAFEDSSIDEVILVTGEGEEAYCRENIVEKYHLAKVKRIISGGAERYHSVYHGLQAVSDSDYVLIHDGARPFITTEMIERTIAAVKEKNACVVGVHTKDTIKITDNQDIVTATPARSNMWLVQTPQAFSYELLHDAYSRMIDSLSSVQTAITDDAMVVEQFAGVPVTMIEGDYRNIKITTPEDMLVAEAFLKENEKKIKK